MKIMKKKYWTLALDIAIIEKNSLINNKEILNFSIHPEAFVCNYLLDRKEKFIYIKEHMPVHRPNMIKRIYNGYGGRRYNLRAFTEQGVYMLATILKGKKATNMTLYIMDAFGCLYN